MKVSMILTLFLLVSCLGGGGGGGGGSGEGGGKSPGPNYSTGTCSWEQYWSGECSCQSDQMVYFSDEGIIGFTCMSIPELFEMDDIYVQDYSQDITGSVTIGSCSRDSSGLQASFTGKVNVSQPNYGNIIYFKVHVACTGYSSSEFGSAVGSVNGDFLYSDAASLDFTLPFLGTCYEYTAYMVWHNDPQFITVWAQKFSIGYPFNCPVK